MQWQLLFLTFIFSHTKKIQFLFIFLTIFPVTHVYLLSFVTAQSLTVTSVAAYL